MCVCVFEGEKSERASRTVTASERCERSERMIGVRERYIGPFPWGTGSCSVCLNQHLCTSTGNRPGPPVLCLCVTVIKVNRCRSLCRDPFHVVMSL